MKEIIPFNGDRFIGESLSQLIKDHALVNVIETGMWSAHTTRQLRRMVRGAVVTIDTTFEHLTEEFGPGAVAELFNARIQPVLGDSAQLLYRFGLAMEGPTLFYLDAHGGSDNPNPLVAELETIGNLPQQQGRCVVAIHDFFVPDQTGAARWGHNWGDWGRGAEPLSLSVIRELLPAIWPFGYAHHYNDRAEGCQRGIIYIYPHRKS